MNALFVDTSGWGNLIDISQPFHQLSATSYRLARQQKKSIVTTNYIITELVALLTSPLRLPRHQIVEFINSLKTSPYLDIIHINQEQDRAAWTLLSNRLDKTWSLVDCSSFVIMQEFRITDVLTTDRHFEQAGFIRLLK
ncbi:MAG: type II toxin-antitoxin system VapC family toxin [Spirulina sp.]